MGIKIDLLTGLAIVVVIGVIATSRFFPAAVGSDKEYSPGYKAASTIYQVAFKQSQMRK